jgi:hypothetical protein
MKRITLKNSGLKIIACIIIATSLYYSCKSVCTCYKNPGCVTVIVKDAANETVATRTFCSETSAYSKIIQDSIRIFRQGFSQDGSVSFSEEIVFESEAIYTEVIDELSDKEIKQYMKDGYSCGCAE